MSKIAPWNMELNCFNFPPLRDIPTTILKKSGGLKKGDYKVDCRLAKQTTSTRQAEVKLMSKEQPEDTAWKLKWRNEQTLRREEVPFEQNKFTTSVKQKGVLAWRTRWEKKGERKKEKKRKGKKKEKRKKKGRKKKRRREKKRKETRFRREAPATLPEGQGLAFGVVFFFLF